MVAPPVFAEVIQQLDNPAVSLPLSPVKGSGQLRGRLQQSFQDYNLWLQGLATARTPELQALSRAGPEVAALQGSVLAALEAALCGAPAQALAILGIGLKSVLPALETLGTRVDDPAAIGDLFRFRVDDDVRGFLRKDVFHIPFESRHLVGVQRYSVTGVPCLYLGASTYACWEELGRPSRSRVAISAFRATEPMRILDLALFPRDFPAILTNATAAGQGASAFASFGAYFRVWPLIAACSMQRANLKAPFHEEYLIPQLILQWVRAAGWDGIRYSSTRTKNTSLDLRHNFVFPVQTTADSGHCPELRRKFELTVPVAWEAAILAPPVFAPPTGSGRRPRRGKLRDLYLHVLPAA